MLSSNITIGILAHVDAGKTTLAERILYRTGIVRTPGRVDHGDAFLDTHALEKERGITIFSKQANFEIDGRRVTLLDTPGHVDFSPEMERTLQVLDYAILIISAPDGVTGHVMTLWRLLRDYRVPVFVFINKMDQAGTDAERVMEELAQKLGDGFVNMGGLTGDADDAAGQAGDVTAQAGMSGQAEDASAQSVFEDLATLDETALEEYLETEQLTTRTIARLIRERRAFPCYFGSALKGDGVDAFLHSLAALTEYPQMADAFAARVFKISREGGIRLTWMRLMGGTLKVKQMLPITGTGKSEQGDVPPVQNEKADQIRIYNGAGYQSVQEVRAGEVCAVAGPVHTFAGQGLGLLQNTILPEQGSVISYRLILPENANIHEAFLQLKQLEEEMPELHITDEAGQLNIRVMGQVQIQILQSLIRDRFGLEVQFGEAQIVYKETIASTTIGSGHYEPLRHYAEVHLLLEPGESGSGITFESAVSTDELDLNWQRLIGTHVLEKAHVGVLTGSELTDVHMTLLAGRAHLKHTEGGDFREATYRAIRQGLMKAESILLEPIYRFRMEMPLAMTGRALADLQEMQGTFEGPEVLPDDVSAVITGTASVFGMMTYETQMRGYTHGQGRLSLEPAGYRPCPEQRALEIIREKGYDPDADTANPSGSIFCAHGAGMFIPWDQAEDYMHLHPRMTGEGRAVRESAHGIRPGIENPASQVKNSNDSNKSIGINAINGRINDKELMAIFDRTYGPRNGTGAGTGKGPGAVRTDFSAATRGAAVRTDFTPVAKPRKKDPRKPMLLVDGYNVIHAWPDLRALADENLDAARAKLMDILANYQGYRQMELILVFDAYHVPGGTGEVFDHHNIHIVYTKEAETADAYIEKAVHRLAREFDVTVATSDGTEQMIIWGEGARRMSARELHEEIEVACEEIRSIYLSGGGAGAGGISSRNGSNGSGGRKRYLFDELPEELRALLEDMRLGRLGSER